MVFFQTSGKIPRGTGSMRAFVQSLAKVGEVSRSLAKAGNLKSSTHQNLAHIRQSSGEGPPHSSETRERALGMWVALGISLPKTFHDLHILLWKMNFFSRGCSDFPGKNKFSSFGSHTMFFKMREFLRKNMFRVLDPHGFCSVTTQRLLEDAISLEKFTFSSFGSHTMFSFCVCVFFQKREFPGKENICLVLEPHGFCSIARFPWKNSHFRM